MVKKLTKSRTDKKLCGVCGGVARYLEVDPTVVRVVWAVVALCAGFGLLAYFLAALIMPYED